MYVRPQLSRKRSCDIGLLEYEHKQDLSLHNQTLQKGGEFKSFCERLSEIMQQIEMTETLSSEEKEPILREISKSLLSLQAEYDMRIQRDLHDIEHSMEERFSEMEDAAQYWSNELFCFEKAIPETDSVDTERFRCIAADMLKQYRMRIEISKSELQKQMDQSEKLRQEIQKNISKRG